MSDIQAWFCLGFAAVNLFAAARGYVECKKRRGAYVRTPLLYPLSIFVWGDAIVFGVFLGLSAILCYLLDDFVLFLLILSVFWFVRSLGETVYWIAEQFAPHHRNAIRSLPFVSVFHGDAIWFEFQIVMQCVSVVTAITSVYLFNVWLG